jgi:hypothetical protein
MKSGPTGIRTGLAAAEWRTDPVVAGLDPRHRLHTAIREVKRLGPRWPAP